MIRLVFALRRKPTLSRAEFQDYWLNKHAPLVASFASDLDILRYVQTHTLTDPANAAAQKHVAIWNRNMMGLQNYGGLARRT